MKTKIDHYQYQPHHIDERYGHRQLQILHSNNSRRSISREEDVQRKVPSENRVSCLSRSVSNSRTPHQTANNK
jgi:hypothetical protein